MRFFTFPIRHKIHHWNIVLNTAYVNVMSPLDHVAIALDIMLHGDCGTMVVASMPGHGLPDSTISISLSLGRQLACASS
jgi:hypothetical protein